MEVQDKKIREQISVNELENNYYEIVKRINEIVKEKNYYLKVGSVESDLISLIPNVNELSQNARKNLAKRLHFVDKKKSRRAINILFLVSFKLGVIEEKIYVDISKKEKEIQKKRKVYVIMRKKTEEAFLEYKKEKGNFYKTPLSN
tara:strand:+ start:809 stop:1246 length:438 start_codon:yes stop_codon:yes gene_type:complete